MELLDIIVVVVSPLVNLMNDQATKLENIGIHAVTLSDIREFKIRRLRTTTTDKHATAHDQNHVTVRFSRVVLRLR